AGKGVAGFANSLAPRLSRGQLVHPRIQALDGHAAPAAPPDRSAAGTVARFAVVARPEPGVPLSREGRVKTPHTASRLSSISAIVLTPHSPMVVSISLAMMSSALATPACPPAPRP